MDSFADILFRGAVLAEQERHGTAARFQKVYANRFRDGLGADERAFIESRDSFYMATVSADGWPYVQHRGGPPGFLKMLGPDRLAMADYAGSRQYVSTGHLKSKGRVSLFLMDYPRQARLKILGTATMTDAGDDPDLARQLSTQGEGPVERLLTITVTAFDWNCPKYITKRFTEDHITRTVTPHVAQLEARLAQLEAQLAQYQNSEKPQ